MPWNEDPNEEMRIEIFSPPYLFKGQRPRITAAPQEWKYGTAIQVQSPDAGTLRSACLMRNCVTTHSYDTNQRLVALDIAVQANGVVQVNLTNNLNLAPKGWYMLFLVSNAGVPSVATWVHVS